MNGKMEAVVGAKISEFRRKIRQVRELARTVPNKIVVEVEARVDKFQRTMGRIANMINSMNTVLGNMGRGSLIAMSPALVPVLAAVVGLIATLGPMLAVMAASTFALVTAFALAAAGAVAFGAIAIPTITKLFDENAKLNKQQKAAREEMEKVKSTWSGIAKELEKPVLEAFTKSMQIATKVLEMARPLFQSAADAVNNLLNSLNRSLDSSPVKAFFEYMNTSAGPMLETLGKAFGNFIQGILSMMVAFGPLAESTANGFLKMSENFAIWADGLKKSEKFNSFVEYVKENMPKVKDIFGDAIAGAVYMFAAFGPLASDMLTWLQKSMGKFKEWAKNLGENQQFQEFIAYIRENAPKVLELVGNLIDFLIELGKALAPMGSQILDVVNNILSWINSMMDAHPWIGKVIATVIVMTGALMAIGPLLTAIATLFGPWVAVIVGAVVAVAVAIISNWEAIEKKVGEYVIKIYTSIYKAFNKIELYLKSLARTFFKAGVGLIEQIIKGIASMVGSLVKKVKDIAGKIRDFLPFSPAKEGPLSDLDKLDFAGPIIKSIKRAKSSVQTAMSDMMASASPDFAMGVSGEFGTLKHDISSEISKFEVPDPVINVYNEWDGEKVVSYVERGSAKRSRITDGFSGK